MLWFVPHIVVFYLFSLLSPSAEARMGRLAEYAAVSFDLDDKMEVQVIVVMVAGSADAYPGKECTKLWLC